LKKTNGYAKDDYRLIRQLMADIQKESFGSYGYRRMTSALRERGYLLNHKLVLRLMKEEGLCCKLRKKQAELPEKKFDTYNKQFGIEGEDLLMRDFSAKSFGKKWVTDMTEITYGDRKLYLCVVIDSYSTEVVGYRISDKADLVTVLKAVDHAHFRYPDVHPILHSDRGWFYRTNAYMQMLERFGYKRSMTVKGSCYDNALAESFFAQLKTELIYPKEWKYFSELCAAIHSYIAFYNTERKKSRLGNMSPVQYRMKTVKMQ